MKFSKETLIKKYSSVLSLNELEILNFSCKKIKKYLSWKKLLCEIGYPHTIDDYERCLKFKKKSPTNTMGIEFYKENYGSLDYETIWQKGKSLVIEKRGSNYDVNNVAKKRGISLKEAQEIVDNLKSKTNGGKENYIRKYGKEQGELRYQNFVEKSKTSIDNYKKRYGENWEERWNHYMNTRDSSSLKYCKEKFGEHKGTAEFERLRKEFSKSSNINYYIEKYGVDVGKEKFKQIQLSKGKTIDEYKEMGYSEQEISLLVMKKSPIYNNLVKLYGDETAKTLYEEYKVTKINPLPVSYLEKKSKYLVFRGGCVSKISINFFQNLEKELGRSLKYGTKKEELKLFDPTIKKCYFYDCFDKQTNTIIEFNGSAYHANDMLNEEERIDWCNPWGHTWYDCKKRDDLKKQFAESLGYNFLTVWDYEVKGKNRLLKKVADIKDLLNAYKKDY
jgi:hypothetical protein